MTTIINLVRELASIAANMAIYGLVLQEVGSHVGHDLTFTAASCAAAGVVILGGLAMGRDGRGALESVELISLR